MEYKGEKFVALDEEEEAQKPTADSSTAAAGGDVMRYEKCLEASLYLLLLLRFS